MEMDDKKMESFCLGDDVLLHGGGIEVARGTVLKVSAADRCHSMVLGKGRIGVVVIEAFEKTFQLQYPYLGITTIGESIDSCVMWDICSLSLSCVSIPVESNQENKNLGNNKEYVLGDNVHPIPKGSINPRPRQPLADLNSNKVGRQIKGFKSFSNSLSTSVNQEKAVSFASEEEVYLYIQGLRVAKGIVFKTKPEETCHSMVLGKFRLSVLVTHAIEKNKELPYPHAEASTIEESINSYVIWQKVDVQKISDNEAGLECVNDILAFSDHFGSSSCEGEDAKEVEELSQGLNTMMNEESIASFSLGEEVHLYIGDLQVAKGTVFQIGPEEHCHSMVLGKFCLSVLVTDAMEKNVQLPYPHPQASTIVESVNSYVIWQKVDVQKISIDKEEVEGVNHVPTFADLFELSSSHGEDEEELEGLSQGQTKVMNEENIVSFSSGEEVYLYIGDLQVAKGTIFNIQPEDQCHSVVIGKGRVSVLVTKAIEGIQILPCPHPGASNVEESVGSYVIWDKVDVCKIANGRADLRSRLPILKSACCRSGSKQSQSQNPMEPKEYLIRSKWLLMMVELFTQDRTRKIASGMITVSHELAAVNNKLLGEDHVGVTLQHVLDEAYFPDYHLGLAHLVAWPIDRLKVLENGHFLGDILQAMAHDDDVQEVSSKSMYKEEEKRPYNFSKRKRADPEAKKQKELEMKANQLTTEESIDEVRKQSCCRNECCRVMRREDVRDARREYHLLASNDRVTYILSLFRAREQSTILKGRMVLKGLVVCKTAFHLIHGFKSSTFYKFQKWYLEGYKVGFHGNKGRKKPKSNTLMAHAHLNNILVNAAEPMPHLQYVGRHGTDNTIYKLPSCYKANEIFKEVTTNMTGAGLNPIGEATFYKIWREKFNNFSIHKNSAFAKCDDCTMFKEQLMKENGKEERILLEKARERHMQEQMSRRQRYYSNRELAKKDSSTHLCIIHDKMDQAKTGIPKLMPMPKFLSRVGISLPIALTGMLTHGRDPGVYAHLSLTGLWPGDADFTVSSLAKCFRDLEDCNQDKSGDIFLDPSQTTKPIFSALMDPDAFKVGYLEPKKIVATKYQGIEDAVPSNVNGASSGNIPFNPLPKHLCLQLDNSGKDNKNQIVMAFCSELVARGHFETIEMSFLMVGHTHEDVDAFFSQVARRIKGREVATLQAMMAEVWESEQVHPVPRLIQEVADYNAYLHPKDEKAHVKGIQGHSQPIAFLFTMKNNVPVYQFKESINHKWTPPGGRCIWTRDGTTNALMLPKGEPVAKSVINHHKKFGEISPFIKKYIEWLKKSWKDERSQGYQQRLPLIKYWENVLNEFAKGLQLENEGAGPLPLSQGFWPKTNHGTGYKVNPRDLEENHAFAVEEELEVELQDEIQDRSEMFVGHRSEKESERFVPLLDICKDMYVLLLPEDDWEKEIPGRIWLAKALGEVQRDKNLPNYNEFKVQWWRPKNSKSLVSSTERYHDCFSTTKSWECDPGYDAQKGYWINAGAVIHGWKSKARVENISRMGLKIPVKMMDHAKAHLLKIREVEAEVVDQEG